MGQITKASVPPFWRTGTTPGRVHPNLCYELAAEYVLDHQLIDGICLVHGVITSHDIPINHAWVEMPGGVIWDPTAQEFYEAESYLAVQKATPEITYRPSTVAAEISCTRHYGPWHE